MISTYIFYPLIIKSSVSLFNCQQFEINDKKLYLTDSPATQCWDFEHAKEIVFFALPGLILWGLFFPIYFALILRKYSNIFQGSTTTMTLKQPTEKKLSKRDSKINKALLASNSMFVFFCNGYQEKSNFWECLIFFRKFFLGLLSSLNQADNNELISYTLLIAVFFFINLTIKTKPYRSNLANQLEIISLCFLILFILLNSMKNNQNYINVVGIEIFMILINWIFLLLSISLFMFLKWKKILFSDRVKILLQKISSIHKSKVYLKKTSKNKK